MRPPQLVVDFSTIPVDACRGHATRLEKETGCRWVDAPVSGGPPAAAAGTLTVMAGGAEEDLARLAPLMADIAGRCTRMGPVGAGLAAKMINQLIVGVGHAMLAECVALCERAGVDAARIPECLAGGYADSNVMKAYWPRMVGSRLRAARLRAPAPQGSRNGEQVGGRPRTRAPRCSPRRCSCTASSRGRGHTELDTSAIRKLYD